jgi:hypothetical protein
MLRTNPIATSAARAVTAWRSACCVSPALPAAVQSCARLLPGSDRAASATLRPIELAARATDFPNPCPALLDARHQWRQCFDQLDAELFGLKGIVKLLVIRACEA